MTKRVLVPILALINYGGERGTFIILLNKFMFLPNLLFIIFL